MEFGLSLGSNQGDRLRHLQEARARVVRLPGVTLLVKSPVYETEPVDVGPAYRDQPFLNAVLIVAGDCASDALSDALHGIETEMGRVRSADRNAPRPIDLDLLYAGTQMLATTRLTLPHPRWDQRRFVVQPLADVRPDLVLPGQARTVSAILFALPPKPDVVLWVRFW